MSLPARASTLYECIESLPEGEAVAIRVPPILSAVARIHRLDPARRGTRHAATSIPSSASGSFP